MAASTNIQWLDKQARQFDEARFGAMTIMLTAQSCVGSIAAAMSLELKYMIPLGFCAAVTMGSNAVFIAQSPARWCLISFYLSLVVNAIIILTMLII